MVLVVHSNVILVMMDKPHYLMMALASVPAMVAVAVVMVVMSAILELVKVAMELAHYQKMVFAMTAKLEIPALHQLFPKVLTVLEFLAWVFVVASTVVLKLEWKLELSGEPWVLILHVTVQSLELESTAELQALVMAAGSLVEELELAAGIVSYSAPP